MPKRLRISMGMTIRPRSSTWRTMPVSFIASFGGGLGRRAGDEHDTPVARSVVRAGTPRGASSVIDTHTHLLGLADGPDAAVAEARDAGVERLACVAQTPEE